MMVNQLEMFMAVSLIFVGQAFVSFDSVELATAALHAVHGYRLHDRPVFVQYARVAPAKPDPKSLIVSAE
ncbi:unnamed protein product [Dibothriocephalus latus]|uniref:RRM domain-containing protein n=1 Tax=Dibothriocephalus latus TaxID=60516 RepID=A0A3P7NPX8_DIBLA|nr:unnamed protein product [Dibothriocephalus latus]